MRALDPRLLRHARAARVFVAASVALGLVTAGLIIAQATLLADAVSQVTLPGSVLIVVIVTRAAVGWAQESVSHRAAGAAKAELRMAVLRSAAGNTAEVATLATKGLDSLDNYFARYLPQVVLAAAVPAAVVAVVLPADLIAGLTILFTLPLIPFLLALVGKGSEVHSRRSLRHLTRTANHLLDLVIGLPTLKAFGRAKEQATVVKRLGEEQRRLTMRTLRLAFLSSLVLELIATVSVALVAVGIGLRLVGGTLDLRTGLLVLILAPEAYLPLRQLGTHFHASTDGIAAMERVFEILETRPPTKPARGEGLGLDGVTVRLRETVLEDFSLHVRPGEVVALTGPSGSGKSTVLHLLLGFLAPDEGRVWADGPIAWVPQRPYLFPGTVAENIGEGDVTEAARAAGVEHLLDRRIGDGGAGISAGERQRVAVARALQRRAPVLLLDEPTANLDEETEERIIHSVRFRGATILMVAHRPALLDMADRVVSLDTKVPA